MASSGPNNPGLAVDSNAVGTVTWSNPSNAVSSNDTYATAVHAGGGSDFSSHYLHVGTFGFAIGSTETIRGIVVEIERSDNTSASATVDAVVNLTKDGSTLVGSNKASGTNWPTTDAYATYGSSTDLWGTTWTPAEINASTFGVFLEVTLIDLGMGNPHTAQVDHVRVTVYYGTITETQGPNSPGTVVNSTGLVNPNGPFSNPNNVKVSDNAYATRTPSGSESRYSEFTANNFGFTVPTTATLTGITVEIEHKSSAANEITYYAELYNPSSGYNGQRQNGDVPTVEAYETLGGTSDLWDGAWDPDDVNDVNFGVGFVYVWDVSSTATLSVDHVRVTVTYVDALAGAVDVTRVPFSQSQTVWRL